MNCRACGWLLAVAIAFSFNVNAYGGPVYLALVLDPTTTAGAGIPAIPRDYRQGPQTFTVQSTHSGPGRFHLYALDDSDGSYGIYGFKVSLTGATFGPILNRSPRMNWSNFDEDGNLDDLATGVAGFSDTNVLSGQGGNPSLPIQGLQAPGDATHRIPGFGRTAGTFNQTPNVPTPPAGGYREWSNLANGSTGQWGNYATDPGTGATGKKWLLLAEGSFTSGTPTIDLTGVNSAVSVFTTPDLGNEGMQQKTAANGGLVVFQGFPPPPDVNDLYIGGIAAGYDIEGATITQSGGDEPITWGGFTFLNFTPAGDWPINLGNAAAANAQFNPANQQFSWETSPAIPKGTYVWQVTASNAGGSSTGTISVLVGAPEPTSLSLLALAIGGVVSFGRRR